VPEPTGQQAAAFGKLELVQVVQDLREIDQADRARAFLLRLVDLAKTPTDHRLAAELAASLGRDDLMVATAKASRLDGVEMVDQLYPMVSVSPRRQPGGGPHPRHHPAGERLSTGCVSAPRARSV